MATTNQTAGKTASVQITKQLAWECWHALKREEREYSNKSDQGIEGYERLAEEVHQNAHRLLAAISGHGEVSND